MPTISSIRRHFPILNRTIEGQELIYLDSAATAQKPQAVIDAMATFYFESNGNPHRGMHMLAEKATLAYEGARDAVKKFLGAQSREEIVFTKNTTESINLVARSYGSMFDRGSSVVLSPLEHHSNIVPWLQLKEERKLEIDWIDMDDRGTLQMDSLEKILESGSVKLVAVTGLSNVLGVLTPLQEMIAMAHRAGAKVLVDAAQLVAHEKVDVQALDCDFLAFSGHKLFGPTGIGVLYGKKDLLKSMPPFLGGGTMIAEVTRTGFTPADLPQKFEAGTQPVAEAVGLAKAIDWYETIKKSDLKKHEQELLAHAITGLQAIPGVTVLGPADNSIAGCVSFVAAGVHPHDLTEILGRKGICLRAGHHCAQPLHERLGIKASTRLSVAPYNTAEEIDRAVEAVEAAIKRFR